ncbi:uncharacterized protein LOC143371529 [Andrena cerasifolii]|uniref:uncharacterized protein LOC143371529 n=1 Tax=Andrena cerasifolii TaxID=2819439 RepID=UPI0040378203
MPKTRRSDQSAHLVQVDTLAQEISFIRRKRGKIIEQITSFETLLNECPDGGQSDAYLLKSHLNSLNEHWSRFENIQSAFEDLDEEEETRRYEIQNRYHLVVARVNRLIDRDSPAAPTMRASNSSPASTMSARLTVKLPELGLPTFDGTIENWPSFFDIFSSSIDRNEDLTPVQKLQYLRSVLLGKAAASIQSLSTTDGNYTSAIEILKAKYDFTRRILLRHCDAIRDYPKLVKDSSESLGDLVDFMNQHLRALKNLGEPIESWNTLLISTILSKVNSNTVWQWEITLKDKKMPSYINLLEFLEKRANCAPASPSKSAFTERSKRGPTEQQRVNKSGPPRGHAFVTTKYSECPVCKGSHGIWYCETFRGQSVKERSLVVEKASLCPNCLGFGHSLKYCKAGACRICQRRM